MGVAYAAGNVLLTARKYKNWGEVMVSIARRREPAQIILKDGLKIEASVGLRFLVREIFFANIYTPSPLSIGNNDIVVDIGANCGVFTLFAASRTRNKVYAYEPAPENFKILERNIAANGLSHITAYDCAVSDKVGIANLFLDPVDGQQNLLSEHNTQEKMTRYQKYGNLASDKDKTYIPVPTTTLPAIIDEHNLEHIDYLKLDCEGAEGVILYSTPLAYLKKVRKIALEFHDHLSQFSHDDIQRLLQEAGFTTRLVLDKRSPLGYIYGWQD